MVAAMFAGGLVRAVPLATPNGKITVDPNHPNRMIYQGSNNPVFYCGPGDPEDYFHNSTMATHNAFLIGRGAKCTYLIMYLVDFGGGDFGTGSTLDTNIAAALPYLEELDEAGVVINLFFYDDEQARPATWQSDVDAIVNAFSHLKNLVWKVAEEYVEAMTVAQVAAVAARIKTIDSIHPVGVHQNSSTSFDFNAYDDLQMFSMQYNVITPADVHSGVLAAYTNTSGNKIINLSEVQDHIIQTDANVRKINWAAAMAGASAVQVYRMGRHTDDSAWNVQGRYDDCAFLSDFMESINLNVLLPSDATAHGESTWCMAGDGHYLAYADDVASGLGIKNIPAGNYNAKWAKISTRETFSEVVNVGSTADTNFTAPSGYTNEVALYLEPV